MPTEPSDPFAAEADATRGVGTSFYREDEEVSREVLLSRLLNREDESGKYVVKDKIAEGGMGFVFEVLDQDLRRINVLKVMRPEVEKDPHLFERFVEEARITGQLEHPNIVPVHDLGVLGQEKLYFSMKRVHGEELSALLTQLRRGNPEYTEKYGLFPLLTIFRKVCDAVAFAHAKGFIHRDLKPDNVMVGEYGEVLLMDWGLARHKDDKREETEFDPEGEEDTLADPDDGRTRFGVVKGTPAYMSPEQALGRVDLVGTRSDVFLLGATLYAIATLYPPFTGKDVYEIVDNASENNFLPPQDRAPHRQIPSELSRIILKAMASHPDDRYQTVMDLAKDLDALMAGETASQRRCFEAGDLLMSEGEIGEEAYVLISGKIEVFKQMAGEEISLVLLGPGDVVGEMAMISDAPRSASVRAIADTEAVVITKDTMRRGLSNLPPWMEQVITAVVERLRSASSSVHPLMRADCTWQVMQLLRFCYVTWGQPVVDEDTGDCAIVVDGNLAISEIATLSSLPKSRVHSLVWTLCQSGLATIIDDTGIYIPNLDLFTSFIEYIRRRDGNIPPFEVDPHSELQIGTDRVVLHNYYPGREEAAELYPVPPVPVEQMLGSTEGEQVSALFDAIHSELQLAQTPEEDHEEHTRVELAIEDSP
jgi:serine/threonine-protein kinase